jgi:26S proteasome regulatory subunit N12
VRDLCRPSLAFVVQWTGDNADDTLARFQVHLTRLPSLPPSFEKTPNATEELKIASNI